MLERRVRLLVTQAVLVLWCGSAVADDAKKPDPAADAELLEFLGSVDSGADSQATADDGSWIEYLAQTDIGKVAKTKAPDPNAPPPSGDKKND